MKRSIDTYLTTIPKMNLTRDEIDWETCSETTDYRERKWTPRRAQHPYKVVIDRSNVWDFEQELKNRAAMGFARSHASRRPVVKGQKGRKISSKNEVVLHSVLVERRDTAETKMAEQEQKKREGVERKVQRDADLDAQIREMERQVAAKKEAMAEEAESVKSRAELLEGRFCHCKNSDVDGMIGCDSHTDTRDPPCPGGGWYHYGCVGLAGEQAARRKKTWVCQFCESHPDTYTPPPRASARRKRKNKN
jgi:hypothetical protein